MEVILWSAIGFFSGSIPFSLIVGRVSRRVDIRLYGDHNPGATNVLRAAGWKWAIPAMLLDGLKGAIPVGIAWFYLGLSGWQIVPVALAPVLGHAFSPFLRWRGGKAVATTFGIWSGLTVYLAPTVLGLLLGLAYTFVLVSGWAVILAMLGLGFCLWLVYAQTAPELLWVWLGNLLLLVYTHRAELLQSPGLRPWLANRLHK
jgi:glycerol-3-phosphate acyltransferase PlsY